MIRIACRLRSHHLGLMHFCDTRLRRILSPRGGLDASKSSPDIAPMQHPDAHSQRRLPKDACPSSIGENPPTEKIERGKGGNSANTA